ncbi:MAG: hypothetical protein IJV76_00030, partial [Clostridia bacterium]|nr:hypothetical protein [Clostridia bacterium]
MIYEYTTDMTELPEVRQFISEDEIRESFVSHGSGIHNGKYRIYDYLTGDHTDKEKIEFLKNEYGIGGHSHALSGAGGSWEDHDSRGIRLKKNDCADVEMSWTNVLKRLNELIRNDRYLTQDEKNALKAHYDVENVYTSIKAEHPDDIVLYQFGTAFEMYGEDAKKAGDILNRYVFERDLHGIGRMDMCNINAERLEESMEKLREQYGVTVISLENDEWKTESYPRLEPEIAQEDPQTIVLTDEQQTIVEAFENAGMRFSPVEEGEIRFENPNGHPMTYTSWNDAYGTIDGAEFPEIPGLREKVQQILHPDGIPGWTEETIPYSVGDTVYLENGTPFIIEYIGKHDIQLRDPSLDYPIYRAESHGSFQKLMEQFPQPEKSEQPEYTTKTVAVYPAEENHMPFEVVIQTIGTNEPKEIPPENFRITDDDLGTGGAKTKFRMNMDAINTLKQIESENRHATPEEQEILSNSVGWGGLADAFDASKENWRNEYAELSAALTPEEYTAARSSTL